MVIFGIDPGYAIVGWGVVRHAGGRFAPLSCGAVTTPGGMDFAQRLTYIYADIGRLLAKHKPDAVAVEKLFFHSNQKTALDVAQARGVIVLAVKQSGAEMFEYTPLQVKSAVTGYGRADKAQVMEMTRRLLGLEEAPKPDDTCDALALAICHGQTAGGAGKRRLLNLR